MPVSQLRVLTRHTLNELLVVHLHGLHFGRHPSWGEGYNHTIKYQ